MSHLTIDEKYNALGGRDGLLGSPEHGEKDNPDGKGKHRHFKRGSIHWHPETGAFETHGSIRSKWADSGWEKGPLGYPVSDEQDWTLDDLKKMLPSNYLDWEYQLFPVSEWLNNTVTSSNLTRLGRWSLFQSGCITWWENIKPPKNSNAWLWKRDGEHYILQLDSKEHKTKHEQEVPKIAEKVRFWEEQDKINQLMIPRVIELHEKMVKLSGHAGKVSEAIAASESRTTEQVAVLRNAIQPINNELTGLNGKIATVLADIGRLEDKVTNLGTDNSANRDKIDALEKCLDNFSLNQTALQNDIRILQDEQARLSGDVKQVLTEASRLRLIRTVSYASLGIGIIALVLACVHLL